MHKDTKPIIEKMTDTKRGEFLAKAYSYLTDTKAILVREVESELRRLREDNRDDCMDSYDIASEDHHRNITSMLSERDRIKISQIDAALKRIGEVKYGLCETCGFEIGEERLIAIPFTRLCRDCQHDQERAAKPRGSKDEQEFQNFASSQAEE